MKYVKTTMVLLILSLPLFGTEVLAAKDRPCADDVAKLCKDVQPGGGRLAKCLKEHDQEVSAACRSHQEEVKTKVKEAFQACHDDVMQFCSNVQPGGGRIARCLKEHEAKLSTECREKVMQRNKR